MTMEKLSVLRAMAFYSKFVICMLFCCLPASARLNLYLNQIEVRQLLGLSAELYYVREGVVNQYALNFVVPVPATVSSLHFTWQSLAGTPQPGGFSLPPASADFCFSGTSSGLALAWLLENHPFKILPFCVERFKWCRKSGKPLKSQ
ncbi:hypothetical protein LSTR_LSTR008475, partial [Laodelphax striatellus]